MKLQIVPLDVAKDLKELGFDWETINYYTRQRKSNSEFELFDGYYKIYSNHNIISQASWDETEPFDYSAPELDLVCKWFRDKYKFLIYADVFDKGYLERGKFCYQWRIWPNSEDWWVSIDEYKTYEKAQLEGIKEVIKHFKNDKSRFNK